jgi:hypothetical protein
MDKEELFSLSTNIFLNGDLTFLEVEDIKVEQM